MVWQRTTWVDGLMLLSVLVRKECLRIPIGCIVFSHCGWEVNTRFSRLPKSVMQTKPDIFLLRWGAGGYCIWLWLGDARSTKLSTCSVWRMRTSALGMVGIKWTDVLCNTCWGVCEHILSFRAMCLNDAALLCKCSTIQVEVRPFYNYLVYYNLNKILYPHFRKNN